MQIVISDHRSQTNSNTELTISYGPYPGQPFEKRQKRISYYNFICKCSECLKDVCKTICLSCERCGGPVLDPKIVNKKTAVCMFCNKDFVKYESTIKLLAKIQMELRFYCKYQMNVSTKEVINKFNKLTYLVYLKSYLFRNCLYDVLEYLHDKQAFTETIELLEKYGAYIIWNRNDSSLDWYELNMT